MYTGAIRLVRHQDHLIKLQTNHILEFIF